MKLSPISTWFRRWFPGSLPLWASLVVIGIAFDVVTRSRLQATTGMVCEGEYADSLQVQSIRTRDLEQGPRSQYSYLVRSSAKYECPFFGPDGKLRRRRVQASELGTAFAYSKLLNDGNNPNGLRGRTLLTQDTFYDAVYLTLAATLEVPLLTRDRSLAKLPRRLVDVELIE